jgi:predicted acylesterase/phospholipase RssA
MAVVDQASRYAQPTKFCDIVLKGGITSGVVYPLALASLAEKYRFSNIGGTSAGAIAAAAAAAAEYGRYTENAGFDRLAKTPDEVGPNLLSLFQPTPALKPLFDIFVAALKAKSKTGRIIAIIRVAVSGYWPSALLGLLPGIVVVALALVFGGGAGFVALGLLLALIGLVGIIIWRLLKAANTDLVGNDFGLCPGIRQPYSSREGFTDWLARLINEAAGLKDQNRPLTFGDLAAPPGDRPPIQLAMMTTSLMEERPYTLPLPADDRRFVFEKSEWERIFPGGVMAFLTSKCDPFTPPAGEAGEYYHFPDPARLPLIVAARMSLSFPFLISGVPLWRCDFTLIEEAERNKLRRCFFSDGGLSSNFPIHFFDHLMPNSPTFAITLDEFDKRRNRDNVWLPPNARSGILIPILSFSGLGGFLMRLLTSAKDWQDNLQSTLPGYRERIAHVVLEPEEGGLNLAMSEATIRKLVGYGELAGTTLRDKFDLDGHRWRRFLVAMARVEETLDEVAKAYDGVPGGPETFRDFLARYSGDPDSYEQEPPILAAMLKRGAELAASGTSWRSKPTIREGRIPKPPTNLRITPKY